MQPATRNVTNINRVSQNDEGFDLHLSESVEDEDAASTGWMWVTALLIGGALIVSGYLDQESQSFARSTVSVVDHHGGAYITAALAVPVAAKPAAPQRERGY